MRELSLNILDIAQNSISAGASLITIEVSEDTKEHLLSLTVSDNGCGMDRFSPRAQRARSAWGFRCFASRRSRPAAALR